MTAADTMWRWWARVCGENMFPPRTPAPPQTFDQVLHGTEHFTAALDGSQVQE